MWFLFLDSSPSFMSSKLGTMNGVKGDSANQRKKCPFNISLFVL